MSVSVCKLRQTRFDSQSDPHPTRVARTGSAISGNGIALDAAGVWAGHEER